jgi:hypothetical protein
VTYEHFFLVLKITNSIVSATDGYNDHHHHHHHHRFHFYRLTPPIFLSFFFCIQGQNSYRAATVLPSENIYQGTSSISVCFFDVLFFFLIEHNQKLIEQKEKFDLLSTKYSTLCSLKYICLLLFVILFA